MIAERRDDLWCVLGVKCTQCIDVEVVIVVVRDQHEVDRRQVAHQDARRVAAKRSGKGDGACATRPDRIGQYVDARDLDQKGRVTDHGHTQPIAGDGKFGLRLGERAVVTSRPRHPSTAELPVQEVG